MGWRYNFRWRPKMWIFRFNFSNRGLTSIASKIGWWTHNFRSGRDTINTPGLGSFSDGQTRRRRRSWR